MKYLKISWHTKSDEVSMSIMHLVIRIFIAFIVLLILARLMGRKEISQMTFFNFVSAITIGSVGASLIVDKNLRILNGVIALVGLAILTLVLEVIDIKSLRLRKIILGNPIIVIKNGQVIRKAMKRSLLDISTLDVMLRQQHDIFSYAEVDYAIFETNGKLSVLKKDPIMPITKADMKIDFKEKIYPLPTVVISDGQVISSKLEKLGLNYDWLINQLKSSGLNSEKEVYLAQVQTDGTLLINKKSDEN